MTQQELELPKGWGTVKIDEITQLRKIGLDRSRSNQFDSGIPYLKMNNITIDGKLDLSSIIHVNCSDQELENFCLKKNDILFNTRNSYELVGKTTIWDGSIQNCVYNNNIMRIRINNSILPKFLTYFMNSAGFRNKLLLVKKATTNICAIYDKDLKEQLVVLPPLNEQKRIVSKIEELLSKIDSTKQSLEHTKLQLVEYRYSLLKSTFKKIENKCKSFKLNDLCLKITDGTHHTPKYEEDGIPFISVKDIRDERIFFEKCKYISQETHDELIKRCNPEFNDLLITKSGTIGRMAIIKTRKPFSLFVSVALIKPLENINREYLKYTLQNYINHTNISQEIKGGVIKNFHLEDLREVEVLLPSMDEQEQIVSKLEQDFSLIQNTTQIVNSTLRTLEIIRMSVLKQAFQGKLVPQDPNDEPASVLLERIKKEKLKIRQ